MASRQQDIVERLFLSLDVGIVPEKDVTMESMEISIAASPLLACTFAMVSQAFRKMTHESVVHLYRLVEAALFKRKKSMPAAKKFLADKANLARLQAAVAWWIFSSQAQRMQDNEKAEANAKKAAEAQKAQKTAAANEEKPSEA